MPAITADGESAIGYAYGSLAIREIPDIFTTIINTGWPTVEISGIGNIVALSSIMFIYIKNKITLYSLSLFCILFLANNISYFINNDLEKFEIGYYTWLLSYVMLSLGFAKSGIKANA